MQMEQMTLDQIRARRGLTQGNVSTTLGVTQGAVSQLEFRKDAYVSSLRKYLQALGGSLTLVAVFGDERISIRGLAGDDMLDQLRPLVNHSFTLFPSDPATCSFENRFRLHSLSADENTALFEKDNGHLVEIPVRRILEILPAGSAKLRSITVDGSIRWNDGIKRWHFAERDNRLSISQTEAQCETISECSV